MARFCTTNIDITAKLGYGIAIFDSDICYDADTWSEDQQATPRMVAFDIAFSDDFANFAKTKGVLIKEWIGEDCKQIWIVEEKCYFEADF